MLWRRQRLIVALPPTSDGKRLAHTLSEIQDRRDISFDVARVARRPLGKLAKSTIGSARYYHRQSGCFSRQQLRRGRDLKQHGLYMEACLLKL